MEDSAGEAPCTPAATWDGSVQKTDDTPNNSPVAVASSASSTAASLQSLADRTLHFLSHASNETLGACLVGLGASTYLVLGRLGLVLIGIVGGVAIHATWEAGAGGSEGDQSAIQESDRKRKRELGLEVVHRVWRWRDGEQQDEAKVRDDDQTVKLVSNKTLDFTAFQPKTGAVLNIFTSSIIQDYVNWWYSPVLPEENTFPSACRQTLTAFLLSLSNHLARKRPVDTFLDFVTNSTSIIIVFLNELSAALNASPNSDAASAVGTYMQLKPDSNLVHILDTAHQDKKLDMVAEEILRNYLDPKAYNCPPVQVFLKEILSKLVLSTTIQTCSKPEWINGWIVYLLEEAEESELVHAIDDGIDGSTGSGLKAVGKLLDDANDQSTADQSTADQSRAASHKRHLSRAEEAMDEAMQEAKRLTQLIQEEEESRKEKEKHAAISSSEDVSESATQGVATPTSSQSELERQDEADKTALKNPVVLTEAATPDYTTTAPSSTTASSITTDPPITTAQSSQRKSTYYDPILPAQGMTTLSSSRSREIHLEPKPVLTLLNAKMSIFDDSMPGEKSNIKAKPTIDYLIQIEPASSAFPGWMISRKYADFETLHEVLRRISVITGAGFNESHATLPTWKMHTKASLRGELERYLSDASSYQPLAESEGMKRFLEKEQGLARSPSVTKGFGWPAPSAFDTMGKNMMDVLTKAPKDVAGGGKSFFGGVTNVLGSVKKPATPVQSRERISVASSPIYMDDSYMGNMSIERSSHESARSYQVTSRTSIDQPPSRPGTPKDFKPRPSISTRYSGLGRPSGDLNRSPSYTGPAPDSPQPTSVQALGANFNLPPPPSLIDGYDTSAYTSRQPKRSGEEMLYSNPQSRRPSQQIDRSEQPPPMPPRPDLEQPPPLPARREKEGAKVKQQQPITQQEISVAIELMFAVITELYTLSSAWNFRRTLLGAAKTFLLRPGNPQLEAIRVLVQESVIDANTSDAGIAAQILKLRENSLPTAEELKKWPAPLSDKEKEDLRVKARKLLVEKGMPQALTSVMGAAASGEALGKVFDCLQLESVARGLIFGLVLQGLRAAVQ